MWRLDGGNSLVGDHGGKTILLAGAGCAAGLALARGYAGAGARLVAIDAEEATALRIAEADPARIDALRLDLLDAAQRGRFLQIWEDEPVHALVHLLPLRHAKRPGQAIEAVIVLTEALAPALRRGEGRVLIVFEAPGAAAPVLGRAFAPAFAGLARLLDRHAGAGAGVVALELAGPRGPGGEARLVTTALWLTGSGATHIRGSVLRLQMPAET